LGSLRLRHWLEGIESMKTLLLKSVYAGLGLLHSGKETVEQLGRELAKKANLSERDGEVIARRLQARSSKAIKGLDMKLRSEVGKVVDALHKALQADVSGMSAKRGKSKSQRSGSSRGHRRTTS
jgi:polyhydroxyalkanoate synthesis regulator phasin